MKKARSSKQIVSRQRVSDFGEVLTNENEVNAMLDLVEQETKRIDSRFLEPACGSGNFLATVLERKLSVVTRKYSKSQIEYERNAILALSSIYGIEIQEDNVKLCRNRLMGIFTHHYLKICKKRVKPEFLKAGEYILERNILWGDALTLRTPDESAEPIIFSEWTRPFDDSRIKRRDFLFQELSPKDSEDLFNISIISDLGQTGFIPEAFKDYPIAHYLKLT